MQKTQKFNKIFINSVRKVELSKESIVKKSGNKWEIIDTKNKKTYSGEISQDEVLCFNERIYKVNREKIKEDYEGRLISEEFMKVFFEDSKKEEPNNEKSNEGGLGSLGVMFILFFLIVGISYSVDSISENKTIYEDISEKISKCESVIPEFNKIENTSQVDEIYINASNQLADAQKKTNIGLFKLIGGISGILIGVGMIVIWLRRIDYERTYRIPDMMWILKKGGIFSGILIILIFILTFIVGFDFIDLVLSL